MAGVLRLWPPAARTVLIVTPLWNPTVSVVDRREHLARVSAVDRDHHLAEAKVIQLAVAKHLRVPSQRCMADDAVGCEEDPEDGRLLGGKPRLLLFKLGHRVCAFPEPGGGYGWQESCALASQERTPSNPASTSLDVAVASFLPSPVSLRGLLTRVLARWFALPRRRANGGILRWSP